MDIKGILDNQRDELLDIDLDCLEEELATGDYRKEYVTSCRETIGIIRAERSHANGQLRQQVCSAHAAPEDEHQPGLTDSSNQELAKPDDRPIPPNPMFKLPHAEKAIMAGVAAAQMQENPKEALKQYFEATPDVDESFVVQHIGDLSPEALSSLLECRSFSESFLEQFFASLDHNKVARYQYFSEDFFIKHYSELSPTIVLKQGVNDWRKKADRSSKLDLFLRIKGVRY